MLSDCHRKLHNQVCMKDTLQMKYRKKYWVVVIFFLFICLSGCGGHKQQSASIDLSTLHKVKATDFDELSDELSFDFVDKNGNEAKYVEIMDIDVDNLLEQIDICKSFFSKVLKLLVFQGVWMFLCSQFPLFFPLPEKNKGKSYCTLSSSFAASRLASLLACA